MIQKKTIQIPDTKRLLVCSDLHGNLTRFQNLLASIPYTCDDILIIVGDICEKGNNSLGLVRYLMTLAKQREVYITMGNCDTIYDDVCDETYADEEHEEQLRNYLLWRKHSLLNEMSEELHYTLDKTTNMKEWKALIRTHFAEELAFLNSFPLILETQDFYFAHAGLPHTNLATCTPQECLTTPSFLSQNTYVFDKTLIVGHWPVSLYHAHYMKLSPIFDREHHVIAIDGGNVIKKEGQINMLLIQKGKFSYTSMDELPTIIAQDAQQAKRGGKQIIYQDAQVYRIKEEDDCTLCEHVSSHYQCWIPTTYLYEQEGKWFCEDFSDYDLDVQPNDTLKLIIKTKKGCYVKKDSTCGWYYGHYQEI